MTTDLDEHRARVAGFDFRGVHPHLRIGTASDRYAAWIGQVYPPEYEARVSERRKYVKKKAYVERLVPTHSTKHYFEHFEVAELDFTFYRSLREPDGRPTDNFRLIEEYAEHSPPEARFFLKMPQEFTAAILRRGTGGETRYEENGSYLDAEGFARRFHEPVKELLGPKLQGLIFEQEYHRKGDSAPAEEHVARLDRFFSEAPRGVQYHLEIRSPHLLTEGYFAWLESRGLGFVYSHWTWLPKLREQWRLSGGRFTAENGDAVVRLLTPPRTTFEEAYAAAHPFDRTIPELAKADWAREMVLDATALVYQAQTHGAAINLIVNNRATGNAPQLAQRVASRVLVEEERRGA